jgi:small subunit ribosomal protein S9
MTEQTTKRHKLNTAIEVPVLEEAFEDQPKRQLDSKDRAYATGRRKQSVARVWLSRGDEFIVCNDKVGEYFPQEVLIDLLKKPLRELHMDSVAILSTVTGGGKVSQAKALQLAISRALAIFEPSYRVVLRKAGLLTVDGRKKEREHCGFRSSRVPQQYNRR